MATLSEAALMHAFSAAHSPDPLSFLLNPFLWAMAGLFVGVYGFIYGFVLLRRKRFIQNIPRCTIRGAPLGLIEVAGKVDGPYTIIAPLSEEECFFYRSVVWIKDGRASWRKAAEESLAAPFFLDDETGKMMVDPRGAEIDMPPVFSEEYEAVIPEHLSHFLSRHDIPGGPLKLEEYCVRRGDALFVMGTLRENQSAAASGEQQFLSADAADLQRRGEMEAILPAASVSVQPHAASKLSLEFDLHPPVVLGVGRSNHPLFISNRSRTEIVQTLAIRSVVSIWGGPILTLLCFWYLLDRLGYL
jgi:hypothetical protein